jgi:GT2 family glycosyltransferase/nucleoside-diphosphate-sugar epimerase
MITAIIVNYNSGPQLTACVVSLLASQEPVSVVVVDNGSSDDSLDRLAAFCDEDAHVTIIRNGANLGFSTGCNVGLAQARGDYVLFINPDCVVPADALGRMCAIMDQRPEVGMAGCLIRNLDGSEQAGCRRSVPTPWRSLVRVLRLDLLFPNTPRFQTFNMKGTPLPNEPVVVEAISGAFMFVRRSAIDRVGTFDEKYFLHCEDLDLCMRFNRQKYSILFVPGVEIMHLKGGSRASPFFVEWHKHKGMTRFYRKFFRDSYPWVMLLLVITAVYLRYILLTPLLLIRRSEAVPDENYAYGRFVELPRHLAAPLTRRTIIVSGATSQVGRSLLPRLVNAGYRVVALSRHGVPDWQEGFPAGVLWLRTDICNADSLLGLPAAGGLIHLAPLAILPERLASFAALGVTRVIAFSSSSKFSKAKSPVVAERAFADRLAAAEAAVESRCEAAGMGWTLFRPTLIYGCGMDRNITLIRRIIRFIGFFPLLGDGLGLRQPVHADDLAAACVAALDRPAAIGKSYELSGGERLAYRAMVARIFESLQLRARFISIPVPLFGAALRLLSFIPRYRDFNVAMAQRMNEHLVYDHDAATRDFGYQPRSFMP